MKKKILSVIVCAAAILSLTACGKNEDPFAGLTTSQGTSSTPNGTSSKPSSKPVSSAAQSSSAPAQSSTPEESKPEESSVPENKNEIDWDSVPYADELDFEVVDVDGGVQITNYLGLDTVVKIPETIDGKKVVALGTGGARGVFNSNVTHVKIPDSASDITRAFYNCTSLVSANIPSSVTTLSIGAFYGCTSLSSIDIPNTVTLIDNWAFAGSGLESLTVPDSVKVFGHQAIQNCANLKEVRFPKGIRTTEVDVVLNDIRKMSVIDLAGCSSLTNTDFLKNVKPFADDNGAFLVNFGGCSSLTSVTYPDGVQVIGSFYGCENLTEITIPNSVTNVGYVYDSQYYYIENTLYLSGCKNLKKLTLSDNLGRLYEIGGCPEDAEIVYKGKTYKTNQLPNLYKAVNGN